jgi:hypothetical protein
MDINSEFNACMYRDKCRENVATIESLRQQLTKPADGEVLLELFNNLHSGLKKVNRNHDVEHLIHQMLNIKNYVTNIYAVNNPKPADEVLIEAAKSVVERWETPLWKDAAATAGYIYRLRDAINTYKPADETISVSKGEWEAARSTMFKLAAQMAMKQNMPDVDQVTHSVNIPKKSWRSIHKMCCKSTQQCNDWAYELRQAIDKITNAVKTN